MPWVEIPTDSTGLLLRTYNNMDFYVRSDLAGTFATLVPEDDRYREILIKRGSDNPNWSYRSTGNWIRFDGNIAVYYGVTCYNYQYLEEAGSIPNEALVNYNSVDEAIRDFIGTVAISYVPINSVLSGPETAVSGEIVNVSVSFPDGYIYQEKGISVYNKDGSIPFVYSNGTLTFTVP